MLQTTRNLLPTLTCVIRVILESKHKFVVFVIVASSDCPDTQTSSFHKVVRFEREDDYNDDKR